MGLYEVPKSMSMLNFGMGTMLANFHMWRGITKWDKCRDLYKLRYMHMLPFDNPNLKKDPMLFFVKLYPF